MRQLADAERAELWEAARREHPGDPMMQEIRFVRFLQVEQTRGMTIDERIRYYAAQASEGRRARRKVS